MTSLDGRHCVLKGGPVRGSWNHSDSTERNVKKGIGEKSCVITNEEARGIALVAPRHLTNCTRAVFVCLSRQEVRARQFLAATWGMVKRV